MRFQLEEDKRLTVLKVVGVGGAGGNAVNRMVSAGFGGVDFSALNTDLQVLRGSEAHQRIQIGTEITRGTHTFTGRARGWLWALGEES